MPSRFEDLATLDDAEIDLAEAALAIATDEYPNLDVGAALGRLDILADEARARVDPAASPAEQIAALNRFLFVDCGFIGNEDDYFDPRNSFLNDVLERRIGIPISLALVYTEVAKRLGLPIVGVSFPGHFLVKHAGPPEIYVDPFLGEVLSLEECGRRLETLFGHPEALEAEHLRAARPREVLVRMLRNLKQVYVQRGDFVRALSATSRIVLLAPKEAAELRDRGVLHLRLECFSAAVADFERWLEIAPDDPSAAEIRAALPELRSRVETLQ